MTEEADYRCKREISFTLNQGSYETGYTFLSAPVPLLQEALGYLEELQRQEPYGRIEIRMIDELAEPEVADRYDYYYVRHFTSGTRKCTRAVLCPTRWRPYSVWPSTSDRRKAVFAEKGMTI